MSSSCAVRVRAVLCACCAVLCCASAVCMLTCVRVCNNMSEWCVGVRKGRGRGRGRDETRRADEESRPFPCPFVEAARQAEKQAATQHSSEQAAVEKKRCEKTTRRVYEERRERKETKCEWKTSYTMGNVARVLLYLFGREFSISFPIGGFDELIFGHDSQQYFCRFIRGVCFEEFIL